MRKNELFSIRRQYKESGDIAKALGLDLSSIRKLRKTLLADLSSGGLKWIQGSLPDTHKILISDHLIDCVRGIGENLVEARLHQYEQIESAANERKQTLIKAKRQTARNLEFLRKEEADDELFRLYDRMHIAGFFRAIGSALDCLGAAIIGIVGLPTSLRKADFASARKGLNAATDADGPMSSHARKFREDLELTISSGGPQGWLTWAIDYRNMLAHRGRRVEVWFLKQLGQSIDPRRLLARSPGNTQLEIASLGQNLYCLKEDAQVTMDGILKNTLTVVIAGVEQLNSLCGIRRNSPKICNQPSKQWDLQPPFILNEFNGFVSDGSDEFDATTTLLSPDWEKRLKAGLIHDAKLWRR